MPDEEYDGRPAPLDGCDCPVCDWVALNRALTDGAPIKPGSPEWRALLEAA